MQVSIISLLEIGMVKPERLSHDRVPNLCKPVFVHAVAPPQPCKRGKPGGATPGKLHRTPAVYHRVVRESRAHPESALCAEKITRKRLGSGHGFEHVVKPAIHQLHVATGPCGPERLLYVHVTVIIPAPRRPDSIHGPHALQPGRQPAGPRTGGQQVDAVVPQKLHARFRQVHRRHRPEALPGRHMLFQQAFKSCSDRSGAPVSSASSSRLTGAISGGCRSPIPALTTR